LNLPRGRFLGRDSREQILEGFGFFRLKRLFAVMGSAERARNFDLHATTDALTPGRRLFGPNSRS
jgi:hypothetical protein